MFAAFSLAAILYAGAAIRWRHHDSIIDYDDMIGKKRGQIQKLEESIAKARADSDFAIRFEKQQKFREDWKQAFHLLEEQRKKAAFARQQHDQIKKAFLENRKNLQSLKKTLGLNEDFLNVKLEDAFHHLKRLQQIKERIFGLKEQMERSAREQEKWLAGLKDFLHKLGISGKQPEEAVYLLKDLLEKESKKEVIFQELQQKLAGLQDEALLYEKEQQEISMNMAELLQKADVESEEAFREKARLFEQREKYMERLRLLAIQIGGDRDLAENKTLGEIKAEMDALNESIEALHLEQSRCRDRLASLAQNIRFLEEGGTYTERLHRFCQLRSVFNEEARKWAQMAVAKCLLDKMIQKFQEERFPKAIQKAEEFFMLLTDGEYRRLHVHEDGSLLAERADRVFFTPAELSKGTGEQLYTAIRLGLVHVLRKDFPFPIVIDDGFVNFDERRTTRVLQLIRQMSAETQVLFFTCHRHMMNPLAGERAIMLDQNHSFQWDAVQLETDMV
jgi:uncharacterized protein YhaN